MAHKLAISVDWQGGFDRRAGSRTRHALPTRSGSTRRGSPEAWGRDCFTLLTQLAERTKRIRLGTGIVNVYSRTPAALAQHFATLDELSGGRMIAGFGTSGAQVIEHFHGVRFEPSLTRMKEVIEIFNMLIRHEPLQYKGKLFTLERGFTLRFAPPRPHIPIHLATLNPKALDLTASHADGWLPVMIPIDKLGDEIKAMRTRIAAAGRDAGCLRGPCTRGCGGRDRRGARRAPRWHRLGRPRSTSVAWAFTTRGNSSASGSTPRSPQ